MTEAPENIFLLPKDAALFGQKYGHPDVQQVHVGDESVQYVRADLARPVTVAEAAKVLLGAKAKDDHIEAAMVAHYGEAQRKLSIYGADLTANGKNWSFKDGFKRLLRGYLRALSHEGGE